MWLGEARGITARDLFASPVQDDERSDRDAVADIIRESLSDGPKPRAEVMKAVGDTGLVVSSKMFQRACRRLGIKRHRTGFGSGFVLTLPGVVDDMDCAPVTEKAVQNVQVGADQDLSTPKSSILDSPTVASDMDASPLPSDDDSARLEAEGDPSA